MFADPNVARRYFLKAKLDAEFAFLEKEGERRKALLDADILSCPDIKEKMEMSGYVPAEDK